MFNSCSTNKFIKMADETKYLAINIEKIFLLERAVKIIKRHPSAKEAWQSLTISLNTIFTLVILFGVLFPIST